MTVSKRTLATFILVACWGFAANAIAQDPDTSLPRTMRPVIRGRQAAVSSMKAEATEAARCILQARGNAFDAAVASQAPHVRHVGSLALEIPQRLSGGF